MRGVIEIIIAGVGGQGSVKAAQILGSAALRAGLKARVSDVFGISQRGGPVVSHVRIGNKVFGPLVSEHSADVIVGLEPLETLRAAIDFIKPGGTVLMSTRPHYPIEVNMGIARYPPVRDVINVLRSVARVIALDPLEVAERVGLPVAANVVMLGALAATEVLPFPTSTLKESVKENVPYAVDQNLKAFEMGYLEARKLLNSP